MAEKTIKFWVITGAVLLFFYTGTSRLGVDGYELEYLLSAKNLLNNGSLYLSQSPDGVPGVLDRLPGQHDLPRHNLFQVFIAIPFYIAGIPFNSMFTGHESGLLALPLGSLAVMSLMNPLFTLAAIFLIYRICRQLTVSSDTAIICGWVYAFSTMAWPYSSIGMEPLQTTCLLWVISRLLSLRTNTTFKTTLLAALSLCCLMHTKISAPALALPPAIWALVILWKSTQKNRNKYLLTYLFLLSTASAVWFLLYWIRSQSFYSSNFFAHFNAGLIPRNIIGFVLSPGKGFFFYNLILLWGIGSLRQFVEENRGLAILFTVISVFTVLLVAVWDWALIEECWGPRYLFPIVPLLLIASARAFEPRIIKKHCKWFFLLLSISLLIQIPGVLYPNIDFLKYVHTDNTQIVDLSTWSPELAPINVGWHFIFNQLRSSTGQPTKPHTWSYYTGIVGWGAKPKIVEFDAQQWNRPYSLAFLLVRFMLSEPGSQGARADVVDPQWLFISWLFTVIFILTAVHFVFFRCIFSRIRTKEQGYEQD